MDEEEWAGRGVAAGRSGWAYHGISPARPGGAHLGVRDVSRSLTRRPRRAPQPGPLQTTCKVPATVIHHFTFGLDSPSQALPAGRGAATLVALSAASSHGATALRSPGRADTPTKHGQRRPPILQAVNARPAASAQRTSRDNEPHRRMHVRPDKSHFPSFTATTCRALHRDAHCHKAGAAAARCTSKEMPCPTSRSGSPTRAEWSPARQKTVQYSSNQTCR